MAKSKCDFLLNFNRSDLENLFFITVETKAKFFLVMFIICDNGY